MSASKSTHSGKFDHAYLATLGRGDDVGMGATSALVVESHVAGIDAHDAAGLVQFADVHTPTMVVVLSQHLEQLCVGPHTSPLVPGVK